MIQGIDHVGIAVRSIEAQLEFYRQTLGLQQVQIELVNEQRVRVAIIQIGDSRIELLEPTADDSPIARFLERHGEGMHHLALATEDIDGAISTLVDRGVRMIDTTPRCGAGGTQIAFIHPKSAGGVLTELCQHGSQTRLEVQTSED
ncbi:MAG: methylmalonyl-CoA epimerase [Spirochaetaceae bacterium]|nr:MAG: methylmalonyl-CoA epimerase [Spirochaetaceae bacterium]